MKVTNRLSKTTSFAKTSRFHPLANVSMIIVMFTDHTHVVVLHLHRPNVTNMRKCKFLKPIF